MFLSTSPPSGKNRLPGLNKFSNSNAYNQLQIVFGKFPGCFCLTGSEIHLPTYVPINIPRLPVLHRKPFHAPVQIRTVILTPNCNPIMNRSPRFPSEAGFSPPHLHPRPPGPNGTGYMVFVIRSLSSQNM